VVEQYPLLGLAISRITKSINAKKEMKSTAIIYCENEFGKLDGKVANGLVRESEKYEIVGVIDSTKSGQDAGMYLDGIINRIPIFRNMDDALNNLDFMPDFFIYGIAPLSPLLSLTDRGVIKNAIKMGMNIINSLPEYISEEADFSKLANKFGVKIVDIRKPPPKVNLHMFTGKIADVITPVITVSGTDCAVGKRTTALNLVKALRSKGLNAIFVTTGQTGLLQGSRYGIAIDVLTSGFATGEVENAVLKADKENPDIIVVEGQGALGHPAFTSSSAILRGAMPKAVIIQHPPKRINYCDYPKIALPTLESEINLIETFSRSKVIAITLNHEGMADDELDSTIKDYQKKYQLPTTDVLKHGCDKIIDQLYKVFPELINVKPLMWTLQE